MKKSYAEPKLLLASFDLLDVLSASESLQQFSAGDYVQESIFGEDWSL